MTIDEHIAKMDKRLAVIKSGKPLLIAVQSTVAKQATRIYVDGLNSAGSQIGNYNTTDPLYINPSVPPGYSFKPEGKPKTGKKKDGKTKTRTFGSDFGIEKLQVDLKTKYFPSYAAFRKRIGRPTGKVNLVLQGDESSDFKSGIVPISDSVIEHRFKREINAQKMSGHEDHFNCKIKKLTKEERINFLQIQKRELNK